MKETKVYTGRRNGKHAELMQRLDKALKEQHFAFVFTKQELKEHDRELVKEVCEKIRDMAHKVGKLEFCEHCYAINPARAINEHLLNEILGQIESEFEQKEYEK